MLQGGNREHQIPALHANKPRVHLERHFSAGPRQFAAQLDGLGRMELKLQASAFNTQSINHLWQPSVHTQKGLLGEDFSPESNSPCLLHTPCGRYEKKDKDVHDVGNMASSALEIKSKQRIKSIFIEALFSISALYFEK